jgi:hypothetical protein
MTLTAFRKIPMNEVVTLTTVPAGGWLGERFAEILDEEDASPRH